MEENKNQPAPKGLVSNAPVTPPVQQVQPAQVAKPNSKRKWIWIGVSIGVILLLIIAVPIALYIIGTPPKLYKDTPSTVSSNGLEYVSADTIATTEKDIDEAKNISGVEDAVNNDLMYKEYESDESIAGSGVFFMSKGSSYIIKTNGKEHDLLNDIPDGKFSYLEEKDLAMAKRNSKIFVEEISKYPKIIGKKIPYFAFAMIKNLNLSGFDVGGVTKNLVFYDVSQMDNDEGYARQVINHEFAHVLDENGLLSEDNSSIGEDPHWEAFNADANTYVNSYNAKVLNTYAPHPSEGFVSSYAETNVAEDKAEVLCYIMDRASAKFLDGWVAEDQILAKKRDYLINSLDRLMPGFKDDLATRVSTFGEPSDYTLYIDR